MFGCLEYFHVPDMQRKNLDAKSVKCVSLCMSEESKAYKLYYPKETKTVINGDCYSHILTNYNYISQ